MFKWLRLPLVFGLSAAWFSLFQKWGAFPDPDAFYHAKMASLLLERGPLLAFPWLDLTVLHPGFNNQHLFFHYFLVPFVDAFGMLPGAQIAAVIAAGLFAVMAYLSFEKLSLRFAWLWTLVLIALPPMLTRLSLGKASPFAIGFFLFGIVAWHRSARIWAFAIGFLYALTHGGWPLLIGAQIVLTFGSWLYTRFVEESPGRPNFSIALATLGGGLLGTFIHPNFPETIPYLWVQIFQIGVATPIGRVVMGTEWYPYAPLELAAHLSLLLVLGILLIAGSIVSRRDALDRQAARLSLSLGLLLAVFLAMTFKSARFVEYLAPVAVFWLASLWMQIDLMKFFARLRSIFRYLPHVIVVVCLFIAGKGAINTRQRLFDAAKPFSRFEKAMEVVAQELGPGERLFHSDWAQFPLLWSKNDRLRYVAGLDPVFLLQASSTISDAYTNLTLGRTTSSAFETISGTFEARMVLVERKPGQKLEEILRADNRFQSVYADEEAAIFKLIH